MNDADFINLVEKHRHEYYAFIKHSLWNQDQVEDVFSLAVLTAYENRKSFQKGTNFRAWMYKILVNKCFTANRKSKTNFEDIEQVDEENLIDEKKKYYSFLENPKEFVIQCSDEILRALSKLNTLERTCFLLFAAGEYSYQEVSQIVEIPTASVGTHMSRGRAKLRKILFDYARQHGFTGRTTEGSSGAQVKREGGYYDRE
ncbi:MAG: RNA polymerase sigma factor [Planctomycetes bacterium]|nr:RNA polymerase sigma factor [Planctomycetota bacterium]